MRKTRTLGEPLYCLTFSLASVSMYGDVLMGVCEIFDSISVAALSTSQSDGRAYADMVAGHTRNEDFLRAHTCISAIAYEQAEERSVHVT